MAQPPSAEPPSSEKMQKMIMRNAMACLVLGTVIAVNAQTLEFYVSSSGSDVANGTRGKPFATLERARDAVNLLAELPIYFDDSMASTVPAIHAAIRRAKLKAPIGLVIVDYLQLLGNLGRELNRAQAVGANSRALKMAAREFQCPFMVLSQFKRPQVSEKTGEVPKPTLSDFKESGDIENDADVAWFIHRPSTQEQDQVPVSFILAKQREGPRDIEENFYFFPKFQRFDGRDE
jgi:replicative DNA helicase